MIIEDNTLGGFLNFLKPSDFKAIGVVTKHCDYEKLNMAILQALQFDIFHLFGYGFIYDLYATGMIEPVGSPKRTALKGGNWSTDPTNYLVPSQFCTGIQQVWAMFAYARYKIMNEFNDTMNGTVSKKNDFSAIVALSDIKVLADNYRNMAFASAKTVKTFLCHVTSDPNNNPMPLYDRKDCPTACENFNEKTSVGHTAGIKFGSVKFEKKSKRIRDSIYGLQVSKHSRLHGERY